MLQQAYRAVLERGFSPEGGGVYISYYLFGSPAHKYKLVPKHWITEINGVHIADLSSGPWEGEGGGEGKTVVKDETQGWRDGKGTGREKRRA